MSFGDRLRIAMERKGWDQKTLAVEAKLSESAVSRHLDSARAPRADSLRKYADALGVSVSWLGYGRSEMPGGAEPGPVGGRVVGLSALDLVLRDYVWPDDMDMVAIDTAEEDAQQEAATPAGSKRSPAAWRAYLARLSRRQSDRRVRRVHD